MKTFIEAYTLHQENSWFSDWFDSPYYPILYKNRDSSEAQFFIGNLADFLHFQPTHQLLDIACGRGRHSIYLNQKGLDVVGIDLSKESIEQARLSENERLRFFVQDMREFFAENKFDFALNLFTSFGYFDSEVENLQAIQNMAQALKQGGKLVIDFFNSNKVINQIIPFEAKTIEGIEFRIHKEILAGFIVKTIDFEDKGTVFHFQEKVKAIDLLEFEYYFQQAGLSLLHTFGDYQLSPYNSHNSDRLIMIAEKR